MEAHLSEAILIGPAQAAATGIKATIIHPTALSLPQRQQQQTTSDVWPPPYNRHNPSFKTRLNINTTD